MADDLQATINMIDYDLPHLHKQRWARVAEQIREQVRGASGVERDRAERRLTEHYKTQFDPASSRPALIEEARRAKKLKAGHAA